MTKSLSAVATCVIAFSLLTGCATHQNQGVNGAQESPTPGVTVSAPPGVEAVAIEPRTGAAAVKARMDVAHVIDTLPWPSYLASVKAAATQPATTQPQSTTSEKNEPPLAAQEAYAEGREEWLNRHGFDAIRSLQTAETLAPDRPEILRLLGQIYTISGNKVRGGYYLERAVRADPKDIESLFMLGQFALEQGRWDAAIVTYAYILSQRVAADDMDAGMRPLISFSLAGALDHEGYDRAAIEQYTISAGVSDSLGRTTRFNREVGFLARQRTAVWQALGDAHNRLGDPAAALDAYRRAADLSKKEGEESDLTGRIVFTLLRLGRRDEAVDAGVEYVRVSHANDPSLDLLKYLAANGADKERLSSRLEKAYPHTDRPPQMTIALASLLGGPKGRALLESHLAAKPEDRIVYEELVRQAFAEKADPKAGISEAALAGIAAIETKPMLARDYAGILVDATDDQDKLRSALNSTGITPKEQTILHYFRARSLTKSGQVKAAIQEFAAAAGPDGLSAARVDEARLLLATGQAAKAEKILETLHDHDDAETTALRVQVLAQTGRSSEALNLLNTMIAKEPLNTDLMLEKAVIQRLMNDPTGAERTLDDALDLRPTSEPIYAALFNLYDSNQGPPDALQQYQRLMMRMERTIPQSRLARLKNAELLSSSRQFDQAEQILRALLAENPKDYEALDYLLDVMIAAGQKDEADAYIHQRLTESPKDPQLYRTVDDHYRYRVKDIHRADEVTEQFFFPQPPGAERSIELSRVYSRTHRIPLAEQELLHAIDQFPDHKENLVYELGEFYDRVGQKDRSEKTMADLLKEFPDDARGNNGLGYAWADRGVNLEQAKAMIQKALDSDPNSGPYLDSMGWVCYKLGRFAEAVKWSEQARAAPGGEHPVILEHMGDALYRNGIKDKAVQAWQQAQMLMSKIDLNDEPDPDLVGIGPRLTAKILAVQQGHPAPVAEVPSAPPMQPKP